MQKCALTVCTCVARVTDTYCSDYCREAAAHSTERDFCQCAHAGCVLIGEVVELATQRRPPSSERLQSAVKANHASGAT